MRGGRFMLAERGTPSDLDRLATSGYSFDLKIDGIRALAEIGSAPDAVRLTSRNGLDLTGRFPEVAAAARLLRPAPLVLDAEIAVPAENGLPSWPRTQRRTARTLPGSLADTLPAVLYVFDLLQLGESATTDWPFARRRTALEALAANWAGRVELTVCSPDPGPLWSLVLDGQLEGVVAKRRTSRYVPGRSRDWIKVKALSTVSCLVGGAEWSGAPGASQPRSLQLFLLDGTGTLVPVGKASAGVSARLRRQLMAGLQQPPLVVEVEYSQVTDAGLLRHPVVRRVRTDVDVLGCRTDQLRGLR